MKTKMKHYPNHALIGDCDGGDCHSVSYCNEHGCQYKPPAEKIVEQRTNFESEVTIFDTIMMFVKPIIIIGILGLILNIIF